MKPFTASLVLASTVASTIAWIYYVHRAQAEETQRMHETVLADIERQNRKREQLIQSGQLQESW